MWPRDAPMRPSKSVGRLQSADPQTGVAPGMTRSRNVRSRCRCSMCPAIHINSRSWLRSSSTHEPSDPPHRVVYWFEAGILPPAQHRRSPAARYLYRSSGSKGLSFEFTQPCERNCVNGGGRRTRRPLFKPSPSRPRSVVAPAQQVPRLSVKAWDARSARRTRCRLHWAIWGAACLALPPVQTSRAAGFESGVRFETAAEV